MTVYIMDDYGFKRYYSNEFQEKWIYDQIVDVPEEVFERVKAAEKELYAATEALDEAAKDKGYIRGRR